jgi:DNA mismatch repair ATPase MutL
LVDSSQVSSAICVQQQAPLVISVFPQDVYQRQSIIESCAERSASDLAEHLRTQPLPPSRDGLLAELLHMVACKAAIKAGQPLTPPEIDALLERRHLVGDSHHCPHGRPTALVFTRADLEKQFGRI